MSLEKGLGTWFRDQIEAWTLDYQKSQNPRSVSFRELLPALTGDKLAHMIHPYPAKLLPHIPAFFLGAWRSPEPHSMLVADPFCGSGTVLLEAAVSGFHTLGADINPLARLITKTKLAPPSTLQTALALKKVQELYCHAESVRPKMKNLKIWYDEDTIHELGRLRGALDGLDDSPERDFLLLAFAVCVRKVSKADPRLPVPVRISLSRLERYGTCSRQLQRHLAEARGENVLPTFHAICERNLKRIQRIEGLIPGDRQHYIYNDARTLADNHRAECVDFIVTSPPYVGAQKYIRSSSLALAWTGLADDERMRELKSLSIGREYFAKQEVEISHPIANTDAVAVIAEIGQKNKLRAKIASQYLEDMQLSIRSMFNVLKPGGKMLMICGSSAVAGLSFDTPRFLACIAKQEGFGLILQLRDDIRSRSLLTKRNRTSKVITSEMVLLMEKPA